MYGSLNDRDPPDAEERTDGDETFTWNFQSCTGTPLHKLLAEGNLTKDAVVAAIEKDGDSLTKFFKYTARYKGEQCEARGKAILIAGSEFCNESKAIYDEIVKRDPSQEQYSWLELRPVVDKGSDKPWTKFYNVTHAATFGVARLEPDDVERRELGLVMVKYLLSPEPEGRGLDFVENSKGETVLHLAFRSKSMDLVREIRRIAGARDANLDAVPPNLGTKTVASSSSQTDDRRSPISRGLEYNRFSAAELVDLAPTDPEYWARTTDEFLHGWPQCGPAYVKRLVKEGKVGRDKSASLSKIITVEKVCDLVAKDPAAAVALLDALTLEPKCEKSAWHPLPQRISVSTFSIATLLHDDDDDDDGGHGDGSLFKLLTFLHERLNPSPSRLSWYKPTNDWRHDNSTFHSDRWHAQLSVRTPPFCSVKLRVCHVENLLDHKLLDALVSNINIGSDL